MKKTDLLLIAFGLICGIATAQYGCQSQNQIVKQEKQVEPDYTIKYALFKISGKVHFGAIQPSSPDDPKVTLIADKCNCYFTIEKSMIIKQFTSDDLIEMMENYE